jgi:hypothetical protein
MVTASFEHEGNSGLLVLTTHFGKTVQVACEKQDDETFRLGGTAINEVVVYEGLVLRLPTLPPFAHFRAFRSEEEYFEGTGTMSHEEWDAADLHCWITEYYDLDMEGKKPGWFISKNPICDAHFLFVNLDVIDGGCNTMKRYRVSPLTGEYKVMETING